jgi:NADH-quinone oxidoreductase subunit L
MEIALQSSLLWIVLFPLSSAAIIGLLGRRASREVVQTVGIASVAVPFILSLCDFVFLLWQRFHGNLNPSLTSTLYRWFSIVVFGAVVPIDIRFVMDSLSSVMALVVTGMALLIHIYSCGYMAKEPFYARFFSYLNLLTASTLVLVLASNLPLMFAGWEGVGLCSSLLIGFWYENWSFAAAGRKAFVANRIGDFGVLIGMFLLVRATGSFEFSAINRQVSILSSQFVISHGSLGITVATAATLFLFMGCTGKSAQIPLFVWFPDAVVGPTPVCALMASATAVASGIYLICRMSSVFAVAPYTMALIAAIGTLTALMAASIAMVQVEIKRVLAYSTISQLGLIFAALGCGAFAAGFFHLFTHAFFEACLFLGAGSVIRAVGARGDVNIRTLGGLRYHLPLTHLAFASASLAMAGFPLVSGFFSKNEILRASLNVRTYFWFAPGLGQAIFVFLVATAAMTAFYMGRVYLLTFWGTYRGGPAAAEQAAKRAPRPRGVSYRPFEAPHESPRSMTWPLIILGLGSAVVGYAWVGMLHFEPWVHWLRPTLAQIGIEPNPANMSKSMVGGLIATGLGFGLAWAWYGKQGVEFPERLADQLSDAYQFLRDEWRIDEFYNATVLRASRAMAIVSANFDRVAIDGFFTAFPTKAAQSLSTLLTRLQTGVVHDYGAVMILGLFLLGGWYLLPHPRLTAEQLEGPLGSGPIHLGVVPGLGYQYRWDFDSDGRYDTQWQNNPTAIHQYQANQFEPGPVAVLWDRGNKEPGSIVKLKPGETLRIEPRRLGRWERVDLQFRSKKPALVGAPPRILADQTGLAIRPNGALVTVHHRLANPTEELRIGPGEKARVGDVEIGVAGSVRATVLVKSAFGVEAEDSIRITLGRPNGSISGVVTPVGNR